MAKATAITPEWRISPTDTGIWKDEHVEAWRRVARFVSDHGAVPGIQLAHAGWKASTAPPWLGDKVVKTDEGGWQPVGVGDDPFTHS
jgi:2,4-dienoyl-CoA reductase-like NADH-dependent reductase (Old Yellow Enzyme family)